MTSFTYTAIPLGRGGPSVVGSLEAPCESTLRRSLRGRGLLMIEARAQTAPTSADRRRLSGRRSRADACWFFETLSVLLDGAAPLESAFETMEGLAPNARLSRACESVLEAMRRGAPLGDAIERVPDLASSRHLALLRVGHDSGRLAHVIRLVHQSLETNARIRSSLAARLLYPIILVLVALLALWGISGFVIPRFALTLEAMDASLPLVTRLTLGVADVLVWLIPGLILGVALMAISRRHWLTATRHERLSALAHRLPVVGPALWNAQSLVLCESLSVMLEGGADLAFAIDQARDVLDSPEIARRFERARTDIRAGADLGDVLRRYEVFPPLTLATIRAGIGGGDLAGALRRATSACIDRQERLTQRLMTLIEPIMIIGLALVVLWIVYALVSGMLAMNDLHGL